MKSKMNQVGTPDTLVTDNDLVRIPRIIWCVTAFKKSGLSARAFTKRFNEEEAKKAPGDRLFEKPLQHQTLVTWKKLFKGNMKNLVRVRRKKPSVEKSLLSSFPTGEEHQLDFILGCIGSSLIKQKDLGSKYVEEILKGSKHKSLAKAHDMMVKVTPYAKWGEPMSIYKAYRRWEKIPRAFRSAMTKSKVDAYEDIMVWVPKPKGRANEEWQMDELQFNVMGIDRETGKEVVITIYCVTCVDTSTGFLRHIEVSEHPIDKLTFLRALKRSLRGNRHMGVPGCARPVILRMDGASIHEKKAAKNKFKIMDLRQSGQALNMTLIWNQPHSARENPVVENLNGNYKRDLVLGFICFVKEIAPAMTSEDWVTHLLALEEQINDFGHRWNTVPQVDGTSRLEKVMGNLMEGSHDVTEDEIDRAVRYTLSRSFWECVVVEKQVYYNPTLIQNQCRRILVRVRPDGLGADMEAYSRGEHIGTLHRAGDHDKMAEGTNAACKAFINRCRAENVKRKLRFKDMFEQFAIEGAPIVTPKMREILLHKRGLGQVSETPAETPKDAPPEDNSRDEVSELGNGWSGVKL
jgi:hypothetical protein